MSAFVCKRCGRIGALPDRSHWCLECSPCDRVRTSPAAVRDAEPCWGARRHRSWGFCEGHRLKRYHQWDAIEPAAHAYHNARRDLQRDLSLPPWNALPPFMQAMGDDAATAYEVARRFADAVLRGFELPCRDAAEAAAMAVLRDRFSWTHDMLIARERVDDMAMRIRARVTEDSGRSAEAVRQQLEAEIQGALDAAKSRLNAARARFHCVIPSASRRGTSYEICAQELAEAARDKLDATQPPFHLDLGTIDAMLHVIRNAPRARYFIVDDPSTGSEWLRLAAV